MNACRVAAFVLAVLAGSPAAARIELSIDAVSLNRLLASMAPDHVQVALAAGRTLTIRMQDLMVTGFDPAAGPNGGVTASLRLVVPDLGIDLPVAPHLALEITQTAGGRRASFLRFDKVMLNLPLTGEVDVAALLPPLALMPSAGWVVDSARGSVRVTPRLVDARAGARTIRLGFDLDIEPAASK